MTENPKPKHPAQASLCPQCVHALLKAVEERPTIEERNATQWCDHRGVLAVCTVRGGLVLTWNLGGPMTAQEAERMLIVMGRAQQGRPVSGRPQLQ